MSYNKSFDLNLQELDMIEHSMHYRMKRLSSRLLTVKKETSKAAIHEELANINELLGKIHNQKEWYRPSGTYISG